MANALAERLKDQIAAQRARAANQARAHKKDGEELVVDLATTGVATVAGHLMGSGKVGETFELAGYNVPTLLSIGLAGKVLAYMGKGKTREYANDGARTMLNLAGFAGGFASGKESAGT